MTRHILDLVDTYLAKGASVKEVNQLIDMLEEYKSEVQGTIEDCYGLLPDGSWGDDERWEQFKAIVAWLLPLGYTLNLPKTAKSGDVSWRLTKGGKIGKLYWGQATQRFFVTGMHCPRDSNGERLPHPGCLTWS